MIPHIKATDSLFMERWGWGRPQLLAELGLGQHLEIQIKDGQDFTATREESEASGIITAIIDAGAIITATAGIIGETIRIGKQSVDRRLLPLSPFFWAMSRTLYREKSPLQRPSPNLNSLCYSREL